jgi:hypothetical protein
VISNSNQQKPSPLTNPRPYLLVAGSILTVLIITGILITWWSIIQRDTLLRWPEEQQLTISEPYEEGFGPSGANNQLMHTTNF